MASKQFFHVAAIKKRRRRARRPYGAILMQSQPLPTKTKNGTG
jgi:hypothetical protein